MRFTMDSKKIIVPLFFSFILFIYWGILYLNLPLEFVQFFRSYHLVLFLIVFVVFYFTYKIPDRWGVIAGLGLTLILLALALAYKWQSSFSDNFIIGGLLPYKDAKNYFYGANLILNGLPLESAGQATERPLFPSFMSSILLLSGQNLKISLALLVQFSGIGLYFSSRRVLHSFGPVAASLFSTLMYFYIQGHTGYMMSELFGFMMGCIAFAIFFFAAKDSKWSDLIIGVLVLLIAVSARAGTFVIFPLIAIWVGWVFRGEKRFSVKDFILMFAIIVVGFFTIGTLYSKIMGVPEGSSFANFSYALYGQVRGGAGWHIAIEDLKTTNPQDIYEAAFDFFKRHPFSLIIGIVKSYRDFFTPGRGNIFPIGSVNQVFSIVNILWVFIFGLTVNGLSKLAKNIHNNLNSLLLIGFLGIFFSIPFLPPIDGGSRFYASTVPFFFVIPAVGISAITKYKQKATDKEMKSTGLLIASGGLIFLTIMLPILTKSFSKKTVPESFSCNSSQVSYSINTNPDSHINLIFGDKTPCDITPNVCLNDLKDNNRQFPSDDFYQELFSRTKDNERDARLIPAINLLDNTFHYFYVDSNFISEDTTVNSFSGCATEVETRFQSIFVVETWEPTR
jgi:hypothetical protein